MATYRKMLVTGFAKIAKRWEDSKKTPHSLRKYGYKNARQWGRAMVANYYVLNSEVVCDFLAEEIERAILEDIPLTQAFFDDFADEEISAW